MGLLSRVASMGTLDEMGNALVDRLTRIPQKNTTSDTALNMLKTYISFKAGACLFRDPAGYTSYSILGFGKEMVHIPLEVPSEHEEKFYKIPETNISELQDSGKADTYYWIFNLTAENPPGAILLLAENTGFYPETVNLILEKAGQVFLPFEKKKTKDSPGENETINAINEYFDDSGPFNCCIFNISGDGKVYDDMLLSVKSFGKLLPLRGNNFILLFPSAIDQTLLFHHLDKRFKINIVEQFLADTPQKALGYIQNYI